MVETTDHWQARPEAGTTGGIRFLMWVASHLGRRVLFAILLPVSVYFYCVRGPERAASRAFLNRALGRPASRLELLRHFRRFAEVTADRFFFLGDRADDIPVKFVIDPALQEVLAEGKAGIFLAAHLGSFEAARVLGPALGGINLRIVLDKGINARFVDLMEQVAPDQYAMIIDSEQPAVALGLTIGNALKSGDWVGFLADRHRPGDRVQELEFLGEQALFPSGPYLIANTFAAPLIGAFCRITDDGYEVHCEVLSRGVKWERKQREEALASLMRNYVARLEHHARASPFSWFNFYNFWNTDAK